MISTQASSIQPSYKVANPPAKNLEKPLFAARRMPDNDILTRLNKIHTNPFNSEEQQIGFDVQRLRTALQSRISIQRHQRLTTVRTPQTTQNLNSLDREIEQGIRTLKRHGIDFSLQSKAKRRSNTKATPNTPKKESQTASLPKEPTFIRTIPRRPVLQRNSTVPQKPMGREHQNITPRS